MSEGRSTLFTLNSCVTLALSGNMKINCLCSFLTKELLTTHFAFEPPPVCQHPPNIIQCNFEDMMNSFLVNGQVVFSCEKLSTFLTHNVTNNAFLLVDTVVVPLENLFMAELYITDVQFCPKHDHIGTERDKSPKQNELKTDLQKFQIVQFGGNLAQFRDKSAIHALDSRRQEVGKMARSPGSADLQLLALGATGDREL